MLQDVSYEALFALAIAGEKRTEEMYIAFANGFSHEPQVMRFWEKIVEEEREHAAQLEELRALLTSEQLACPADGDMFFKAREMIRGSSEEQLTSIETLEDAFQFAHELEHSEVNKVFAYLLRAFLPREKSKEVISLHLKEHLAKLLEFGRRFDGATRTQIRFLGERYRRTG